MKTLNQSVRILLALTLLTGVLYPLFVTGVGYFVFPEQAKGSLIKNGQEIVGSTLIAQAFTNPKYFWPRPAANKYDATSSAATNRSVTSADLIKAVKESEKEGLVREMRFSSASGLDPHISLEAAQSQVKRVSKARGLTSEQEDTLDEILLRIVEPRQLGVLGAARVNVLRLNIVLDTAFPGGSE